MTTKELIDILTRANAPDATVYVAAEDGQSTSDVFSVEILYKADSVTVTIY
jgi:hypothetical protein